MKAPSLHLMIHRTKVGLNEPVSIHQSLRPGTPETPALWSLRKRCSVRGRKSILINPLMSCRGVSSVSYSKRPN